MNAALRSLLGKSLDYAGMFPPSRLNVGDAARNYATYADSPEAWLLGRFVCPAAQLAEMAAHFSESRSGRWSLSAVMAPCETVSDSLMRLSGELTSLHDLHIDPRRFRIESIECRLPADMAGAARHELLRFFEGAADRARIPGIAPLDLFVELPMSGDWRPRLNHAAHAMSERNRREAGTDTRMEVVRTGLKLRTGGDSPPTAGQLATCVRTCAELDVPWKATAGLHQPLASRDAHGHSTFGFLSLFTAAVLAAVHDLPEPEIQAILCDEDPGRFQFDGRGLAWADLRATVAQIEQTRQTGLASFGSCSFDEPCEGLTQLGLL